MGLVFFPSYKEWLELVWTREIKNGMTFSFYNDLYRYLCIITDFEIDLALKKRAWNHYGSVAELPHLQWQRSLLFTVKDVFSQYVVITGFIVSQKNVK